MTMEDPPKLFVIEYFDEVDVIDKDLEAYARSFNERFSNRFTLAELQEAFPNSSNMITMGLLHRILTKRDHNPLADFQTLDVLSPNFDDLSMKSNYLAGHQEFSKLHFHVRQKLIWLVGQLTRKDPEKKVKYLINIYIYLVRQIRGGSDDAENAAYTKEILTLIDDNFAWITDPLLIRTIIYAFLRLIPDHKGREELRSLEVRIVSRMIKTNFGHCLDLGRDFIRAIQDVALINEFDTLWRDMVAHPQRLSLRFTGIEDQFMSRPTNLTILNSRLTPRMEIQLHYIMDGKPKHVGWTFLARFKNRFLSTPESELLIPDIIRYICGIDFNREIAEHPRYLHRWEVIQNLMQGIKNELVAQNAKLALFYDWIYFTPSVDCFYRLEPAAQIMANGALRKETACITATLLEFLYFIVEEYSPQMRDQMRTHIKAAHKELLDRKVIRTVGEYKVEDDRIQTYIDYLFLGATTLPTLASNNRSSQGDYENNDRMGIDSQIKGSVETALESALLKACDPMIAETDATKYFEQYLHIYCEQPRVANSLSNLIDDKPDCQVARALITAIIEYQVPQERAEQLLSFCGLLSEMNRLFGLALWVGLIRQCAGDTNLRARMHWFFEGMARQQDLADVSVYFENCFRSLFDTSLSLFYKVVPIAFTFLPSFCSGNLKMVDLVVKFMDPFGLQTLYQQLLLGTFSLFGTTQQTLDILESSWMWGTFEQGAIWQLLQAECSDKEVAGPVISHTLSAAQADEYPEAMIGLYGFVSQCRLSESVIKSIFKCPDHNEAFFHAILCKLYHLHESSKIERILESVLQRIVDGSTELEKMRDVRLCLGNMKKWKDYWNASSTLQNEFPQAPFSGMRTLGNILRKLNLEPEFYDLVPVLDSVIYGDEYTTRPSHPSSYAPLSPSYARSSLPSNYDNPRQQSSHSRPVSPNRSMSRDSGNRRSSRSRSESARGSSRDEDHRYPANQASSSRSNGYPQRY